MPLVNTVPGTNARAAVQEPGQGRWAASDQPRAPPGASEVPWRTEHGGKRPRSSFLNTDPRLRPEGTGMFVEVKRRSGAIPPRPASAGAVAPTGCSGGAASRLGAVISQGYGRVPTAHLHTAAGTVVPTTSYQSAGAAYAGPQAFAFSSGGFLGGGSFLGSSSSAPASPLDRRTLLYARHRPGAGVAAWGAGSGAAAAAPACQPQWQVTGGIHQQRPQDQEQEQRRLVPAADLLDRMALLRRLAPATEPGPRPPQLAPAVSRALPSFTAAPPPQQQQQQQQQQGAGGAPGACRRWAWDDSLLGAGGRPIAAVPAPGWTFCGDVIAAEGVQEGDVAVAVQQAGGAAALLVVRSPRQHQLCLGEEEEEGEGAARQAPASGRGALHGTGASDDGRRAVAFRPPGPLQHKFGNKPRPRSAPTAEERARGAGLRECGCPRWPRESAVPPALPPHHASRADGGRSRRQLAWADVPQAEAGIPRPRSAGLPAGPRSHHRRQQACSGPGMEPAGLASSSPADVTTSVEVTAAGGAEVVVVASPRAVSPGGSEEGVLAVTLSSPGGCQGCEAEVVVMHTSERAQRPAPSRPAKAAGEAAARPTASPRARLTVSLPAGCPSGLSVRADASAAGGAGASGSSSPIKAWRPPAGRAPAAAAAPPPSAPRAGGVLAEVDVMVTHSTSPPPSSQHQRQQGQPQPLGGELAQLAGEIRRREQSFQGLLGELERIQRKCERLTMARPPADRLAGAGPAAGGGVGRGGGAGAGGQGAAHTTRRFGSGGAGDGAPAAAAGADSSGRGGRQRGGDEWTWESLAAFEASIREQQRKLVEQGVLPPEYL